MLEQLLSKALRDAADKIDGGSCHMSDEEIMAGMEAMSKFNNDYRLSKDQACSLLGVSRSTFDSYVRVGLLPKGQKVRGFKEKFWNQYEIESFKANKETVSEIGNNLI